MSANQGVMRIGEVHAQLRADYPDIELSKIRYYEDKGLVQPSRSRKGYRLYSERDVECLREAIRLAQEEFVPLRVVRLRLIEQGLLKDVPVSASARHAAREAALNVVSIQAPAVAAPSVTARPDLRVIADEPVDDVDGQQFFSSSEFQSRTGLDAITTNHLQSMGLVAPVSVGREMTFSLGDVRVGELAHSLVERGVDLRLLGSLRRIAEREIGVLDDLTMALRAKGSDVAREKARAITGEVAGEVAGIRSVLYERALAEFLNQST